MEGARELSRAELISCLELGKALTSELEPDRLLQAILDKVSALVPADNWSLLTMDEARGRLRFAVTVGLDLALVQDLTLSPESGVVGRAVTGMRPLLVPDVNACEFFDPRVDQLTGFISRAIMCAPLIFAGKALGAIEAVNPSRLDPGALTLLAIIADFAAIAVENTRRYERIRELSVRDDLTGLYNTRHLYRSLQEMVEARRELGLVFVDIDGFKQVVDAHGHLLGSRAIAEVAGTIVGCLEPPAYAVAYGGDEFVVVLPGSGKRDALAKAGQIRKSMAGTVYLAGHGLRVRLTASFGVAAFPGDAQGVADILALADQAMFKIKGQGKNAVGSS